MKYLLLLLLLLTACSGAPAASGNGRLIFVAIDGGDQYLAQYDLADGETTRLFSVPANGWLAHTAVSPDGEQAILAYAPPPPAGQIQFGFTHLYTMPLAADAAPTLWLTPGSADEVFINPEWTPDGTALLVTRVQPLSPGSQVFTTTLLRLDAATGEETAVTPDAIWPRLSPDGARLAYVYVNPQTLGNSLMVSAADGSAPQELVPETRFQVVDVPVFSPDGVWIYFSAAARRGSTNDRRHWLDWLLGVQSAAAHNIPSDWWRIPAAGGQPQRLTELELVGLYGVFAPDGETFYFASTNGLYQMAADGTAVTRLTEMGAAPALDWVE